VQRGEIYYVNLDPAFGREQSGVRPVLVISADIVNRKPLVITVVPGTDGMNVHQEFQTNVRIPAGESGLVLETVFLCFQMRALDPRRFTSRPVGRLSAYRMSEIEKAIQYTLDLP
jgi:mRNA interferase MazF